MRGLGVKQIKDQKGLTLLELTVALALFGILAVVALNLMYHGLQSSRDMEDKIEIINNMNYSLGIISRAIRENKTAGEITITNGAKVLNLSGGVSYQAVDGVVRQTVNGIDQDITMKNKIQVTNLTFTINPNNANSIKIEITARTRDGKDVQSSLEAAIRSDI